MSLTFRVSADYSELSQYIDRYFNYPKFSDSFSEDDFEKEYDNVFNLLASSLRKRYAVRKETGDDESPISMSRYVSLNRSISVVVGPPAFDPKVIHTMHRLLCEIEPEYVFNIDASGSKLGQAYVSVRRSGEVLGYAEDRSGLKILSNFGFPNTAIP